MRKQSLLLPASSSRPGCLLRLQASSRLPPAQHQAVGLLPKIRHRGSPFLLPNNPGYHFSEPHWPCNKLFPLQRGKRGEFHTKPAVFILKAVNSSLGPFRPLPAPQSRRGSPCLQPQALGPMQGSCAVWLGREVFPKFTFFSAFPGATGRLRTGRGKAMPPARSPRTPPRTWMRRASFQRQLAKGTSGTDPQTQARLLPSCTLSTGDLSSRHLGRGSSVSAVPCPHPRFQLGKDAGEGSRKTGNRVEGIE